MDHDFKREALGVRECLRWNYPKKEIPADEDHFDRAKYLDNQETYLDSREFHLNAAGCESDAFWREGATSTVGKLNKNDDGEKKKQRRKLKIDENPEATMEGILRYKYGNEYARRRKCEKEEEDKRKELEEEERRRFCTSANQRSNVKGNKAAQLRCIALSGKHETRQRDLWKIERFTKNVSPHVSTKGNDRNGIEKNFGQSQDKHGGRPTSVGSEVWSSCRALYVDDQESEIDFSCSSERHLE